MKTKKDLWSLIVTDITCGVVIVSLVVIVMVAIAAEIGRDNSLVMMGLLVLGIILGGLLYKLILFQIIKKWKQEDKNNVLYYATWSNDYSNVKLLLRAGANPLSACPDYRSNDKVKKLLFEYKTKIAGV